MRSKNVGALGCPYKLTPNFDALAKKGVLFSNFYTTSIQTTRSVASSLYGIPSDLTQENVSNEVDIPLIGLADIMAENGYQTRYFHNGSIEFENKLMFLTNHGFSEVIGKNKILQKYPSAPINSWGIPDEYLMSYTFDYLKDKWDQPQFLTLFTVTSHHPWDIPPHFTCPDLPSSLHPSYKAYLQTVYYSDYALGLFLKGVPDNTLLFILGDHGQPMGEHENNFAEQRYLYEENLHVPLLIYGKDKIKEPKVITQLASQLDLMPTVMDLLSLKGMNHAVGSSLVREQKDKTIYFHNPFMHDYLGLRHENDKFIYTQASDKRELYDLKNDKQEMENLADKFPEKSKRYLDDLRSYQAFFTPFFSHWQFAPKKNNQLQCHLDFSERPNISREELLAEVKRQSYLLYLDLSNYSKFDDNLLLEIISLHPNIHFLNLMNCINLTERGVEGLVQKCKSLQVLDLTHCQLIGNEEVHKLVSSLPLLERLILNEIRSIDDVCFETLPATTHTLQEIHLLGMTQVTSKGLSALGSNIPKLQKLKITCPDLTDESLITFLKKVPGLKKFILDRNFHLTAKGIEAIYHHCPNLQSLGLHSCEKIDDRALEVIKTLPLFFLNIEFCHNITDQGVSHLEEMPLIGLGVNGCNQISSKGLQRIRERNKDIRYLLLEHHWLMPN